jgi:hypothetical protein
MHVLRMREATYTRGGCTVVPPTTFDVGPGERVTRSCANALEAEALGTLAAGLARASSGSVLIGEYDPRVQPVHCKRVAAFVPHDPLPLSKIDAERYIAYRAALWDIDPQRARAHARLLLERLDGLHEAFAYPVVAALLPAPRLLVLDRPDRAAVDLIAQAAGGCALLIAQANAR